ncbi:MAG: adenine nucleotide alpha hydrolase family protein [Candidatus Lokiarchaeota archaeon]|nr:adenine nucleotide alpha hydrolase family protein [Candidatus Lokiarchaeota archaeon]
MTEYNIFLKTGKCSYCNNSVVIQRKYSGESLCPACFEKNIEKNIYKTISKYKMLKPYDKIIVGLSGGKDSFTLLYNLSIIQKKAYRPKEIIALTIDEGIKDYRDKSVKNAIDFCKELNIEHHIISFKEKVGFTLDEIINIKRKLPDYKYACNYCAVIRRRLLNDKAKELGGTILAMGHNLTDIAETFLMNILYKRFHLIANQYLFKEQDSRTSQFYIKKITPLMRIPEEEIFLYANIKKFQYYPSHCPYREKDPIIRKKVLDFIQECKKTSSEIEFNLLSGFLELSSILYDHYEKKDYYTCQSCGYPSTNKVYCSYCIYLQEFNL